MTVSQSEITMRVPLSGGRFCFIIFDPTGPVDLAPLHDLNSARMAQASAPLFLKPLKENGAGAPLLHSAPLPSHEWRKPSPSGEFLGSKKPSRELTPESIWQEISETREAMAEKASEVAVLDAKLAPVREEEAGIKARALATYGHHDGVLILNIDRADDRKPLFDRLTEISRKWGSTRERRKNLHREVKALEREIEKLTRAAEAITRKKRKA